MIILPIRNSKQLMALFGKRKSSIRNPCHRMTQTSLKSPPARGIEAPTTFGGPFNDGRHDGANEQVLRPDNLDALWS